MRTEVAMSESKISFIYNTTSLFIYDYTTRTTTLRDIPSAWFLIALDTYNDYWIYASNKDIILEQPDGTLRAFNDTSLEVRWHIILPANINVYTVVCRARVNHPVATKHHERQH